MRYRMLGRTGIEVSTLGLGTMMFGQWGNTDEKQCLRMVDMALDAGVNLVDTADVYAFGQAEEIVGRALRGRRERVVLATKVYNPMPGPEGDRNRRGNSRLWITRAVEESLRRLHTDRIDLYQVHRPDPSTDIDVTLSALDDLVAAGKVVAIGTSTFPAEELVEAQWVARTRGRERFSTEQPPYSLLSRAAEAAVLPACQRYELGVLAWSPLNGGWLTGKYRRDADPSADSRAAVNGEHFDYRDVQARERKLDAVERLQAVAQAAGLSLIELALGFVLAHPAVTSAIMGPRTPEQLASQLGAAEVELDEGVLDALDAVVAPGLNLNSSDAGYLPPSLADPARRRRS